MLAKLQTYITTMILDIKHWVDENKKKVSMILLFLLASCLFFGFYMRVPGLLFLLMYINLKDNDILKNLKRNFENYETIKNFKNTLASDQEAMAYHRKHDFPFLSKVIENSYHVGPVFLIVWYFCDINFYFKVTMLFFFAVIFLIDFFMSLYIIWFMNPYHHFKALATSAATTRGIAFVMSAVTVDQSMGLVVNSGTNTYNKVVWRFDMPDGTYFGGRGYALENTQAIDHDAQASVMMRHTGYNVLQHSDANGVVTKSNINFEVKKNLTEFLQGDKKNHITHFDVKHFGVSEAEFNQAAKFRKAPFHPGESDL
jgi:hypothetical protein